MSMRRPLALALTATALLAACPAAAGGPAGPVAPGAAAPPITPFGEPYLFTQQHRDALWWWNGTWLPQSVPSGARLQIQLPATPARWHPHTGPDCRPTAPADRLRPLHAHAVLTGRGELPNEGRIDGYATLQTFDYTVTGLGSVAICLRADPEPEHPEDIGLDTGSPLTYVLTLLVGIPQSALSAPP
ncbi:hypothetical protein [Streptomyces sp. YIM 98790]|uniref:hypothetical protein n=1 Tax=Streptomyces sp. YIM 98790 TaxID=2689077 RepID=UPI00140A80B6|nr:hypothetical protein [Streptomyces sp. YIM 98790]